ncbi:MAG: hypothetical protein KAR11_00735 [Phycisphaerae bacterium]|nr:hypothetical protein [Phycisphaerae bacterium]
MTDRLDTTQAISSPQPERWWKLRDELLPVLSIAAVTILVELGVFVAGRVYGASFERSLLAALGVSVLWCVIAPGPLCVGGRGLMSTFIRGGIIADSTFISMFVLWIIGYREPGGLDFVGVLKIYCICIPLVLMSAGCVAIAKTPVARSVAAVIAVLILCLALTSPLLVNPWIIDGGEFGQSIAGWAVLVNPFFAVCDAVVEQTGFIWRQGELMYEWSQLGEGIIPPPVSWYQTALLYAEIALGLWIIVWIRAFSTRRRQVS